MRPLRRDEIVDRERYEALRPGYREAVIAHKRHRRMAVGNRVTLVFEDRETLRFQVQEMLWVERISEPQKIQHELDVYNELMPADRELSATLFLEITDPGAVRPELDRLVGIDEHVALVLGEGDATETIPAHFDPKQFEQDRISAVQYLRFPLGETGARSVADLPVRARIRVDHPNYRHEAEIPTGVRQSLVADLRREPEPLLRATGTAAAAAPEPVGSFDRERVRALRPAQPRAPGHMIVEPVASVGSLLQADGDLLVELLDVVKAVARDVLARHGRCRVQTDLGAEDSQLRWHVYAPDT
jgi:hypothetical protein